MKSLACFCACFLVGCATAKVADGPVSAPHAIKMKAEAAPEQTIETESEEEVEAEACVDEQIYGFVM